jgi:hypothetical protein
MRKSKLLLIVVVQRKRWFGVLIEGSYDIVGRRMFEVGDSVTASSHADDGYIGGKATAYNIWGNHLGVRHGRVG